jgi:hypothetical protein
MSLPNKSQPFSVAGIQNLYEQVRQDPGAAKAIADEIAANPRAVLEQLFTLSSSQSAALAKASDVHLRQKAQPIINALRSSTPGKLPIRTDANLQPDVATFSCSFMSGI